LVPERNDYHHGHLDEALVEETSRIVREDGISAVSMRELSERLDVSRSAAYRHFEGKEALFAAVAKKGFVELREAMKSVRAETPSSSTASERLIAMGKTYVEYALDHPGVYRLMFQWDWSDDEHAALAEAGQSAFDELVNAMESGQKEGTFRSGDSLEMAFSTWSLVHGVALLILDGHAPEGANDPEKLDSLLTWMGEGLMVN
jgi:AcrR family transcriptional regulator